MFSSAENREKKSRKPTETAENPKMGQDFVPYLPLEMIMNILSRLPIRSIIQCKFVCKSWLDLLATPEFVKYHLSKSVACLAVSFNANHPMPYKFFEFDHHVPRWNMVTLFESNLPCVEPLHSSANGLLFLGRPGSRWISDFYRSQRDGVVCRPNLFICNPITRDYITIPCPQESSFSKDHFIVDAYGFGVSRISGQYKLVRMMNELIRGTHVPMKFSESECQVYTVGTGSWRRIGSGAKYIAEEDVGVFLNGNLHWLAREREGSSLWISCFDLETELFSTFTTPLHLRGSHTLSSLSSLSECLCLCDNADYHEIVIWLMKEYGDEKSWTKEFIFPNMNYVKFKYIRPIKVFENGDILVAVEADSCVLYFSVKTKSIRYFEVFPTRGDHSIRAIMYTPSFVTLRTFAMENVASF